MDLAQRYQRVLGMIPAGVELIAVSKTRTVAEIQALYDLGHRVFGENYPQELRDKQPRLPADIQWHFIGHLQGNKVKYVAPVAHLVHGVDRVALLDEPGTSGCAHNSPKRMPAVSSISSRNSRSCAKLIPREFCRSRP